MTGNAASFRPRTRTGKTPVGIDELFVNPYDYGAVGNGVADDTTALQNAYNAAAAAGGALIIPKGTFVFTALAMTAPGIDLLGLGGTLKSGTVTVGTMSAQDFSGTSVENVRFDGGDPYSTTRKTLVLRNIRGLDIKNNRFFDTGKAISASTADGATGFHTLAMINIQGNRFKGVDYCVHVDTAEWDVCSDWTIADNYYNLASDSSIYMTGVASGGVGGSDGLTISRNVVFGLNYSQSATALFARKRHNVWIGKTNFLRITDNQFFEAGLSSIRLDTAKNFVISDNHFAWGGQREQGDGIEFHGGDLRGTIHGNLFEDWTRSAIAFYDSADVKRVEVGANTYKWQAAPASWKGAGSLTSANCFRVFSDTTCIGAPVVRDWTPEMGLFDSLGTSNRITSRDQKGQWGGVAGAVRRSATIVASTTLGICSLSDFLGSSLYAGLLVVSARKLDGGGAVTKVASYVLNVAPTGPSTCATISAVGLTAGAAADEPSFTWTVTGTTLNATPVGSTAGAFFFEIESLGAVAAR